MHVSKVHLSISNCFFLQTGKSSLGDALYRTIIVDYSSAENVLSLLDLSIEHNALEMEN